MRSLLVSLLLTGSVASCVADGPAESTEAPGAKADSVDRADRDCQIVLRTLAQPSGLPSHNVNGVNWVVYAARVDVDKDAEGAPMVLFTNGPSHGWWQVSGTKVSGAAPGYQRYELRLDDHTVPMGDSTSWRNMHIQVVPFLATAGGRLFDHNRYPSDWDNYEINVDRTWYGDDPAVCH